MRARDVVGDAAVEAVIQQAVNQISTGGSMSSENPSHPVQVVITVIPVRESISEWERLDRLIRTKPCESWPDHSSPEAA